MKFGFPLSLIFHSVAVFGGLLMFGKVVVHTKDTNIIPLKIVTIAKQTNLKPTVKKPVPVEEPEIVTPPALDISEEGNQIAPEQITKEAPKFSLDNFSKMVEKARNENPKANSQKDLVGEIEKAKLGQVGVGEKTELTIDPVDYIRSKMQPCWLIDKGAINYQSLRVEVELKLDEQGNITMLRIANDTQIIASSNTGWRAAKENVVAALNECAPYDKLQSIAYRDWNTMKLNFQPGYEE